MDNNARYQNFLKNIYVGINGELYSPEDAKISVFDRGFLFGDSIYEVTYGENGKLIFFEDHIERLYNSARLLNMEIFISKEDIMKQTLQTLKAAQIPDAYVRIILTRGESELSLDPNLSYHNNLITIVKPKPIYSDKLYSHGLHLIISDVLRNDRRSTNPNAKSGNYLNNVMAHQQAKEKKADDAIMVNHEGHITEGTSFNIWCVKNGVIYTPPEKSGLLKGITRQKVIGICREKDFNLKIDNFTPEFILNADEVFITSSTKGLMPVFKLNETTINETAQDRPVMSELQKYYNKIIEIELARDEYCYF
ncbi:MAG: branched-chain-amino acid aminotransferase [Halobacteriovoraceae bacterium]|nr:branched-chain-amino acid aminotransferase [Halobacteriovoraceae bacterium]|tara:strand:+ start:6504 stop:7427 length:924 start_codon:yes stop_codon:yes gene_type:complete